MADLAKDSSAPVPGQRTTSSIRGNFPHYLFLNITLPPSHHFSSLLLSPEQIFRSQSYQNNDYQYDTEPVLVQLILESFRSRFVDFRKPNARYSRRRTPTGQFLTCTDQRHRFPPSLVPTTYHGDGLVTLFGAAIISGAFDLFSFFIIRVSVGHRKSRIS